MVFVGFLINVRGDRSLYSVMWYETVGLTHRTRPVSGQKISLDLGLARCGLGLAGLCCETRSCYARHHNDLEGLSNFSSTIYVVSLFCAWNEHHYRGNQQWRLFSYKLNPTSLLFIPVVLVWLFWSWFWSCKQRSCYFGLGLGLKIWSHHWLYSENCVRIHSYDEDAQAASARVQSFLILPYFFHCLLYLSLVTFGSVITVL